MSLTTSQYEPMYGDSRPTEPAPITEPQTWNEVLTDLAWITEWAERFPNEDTESALVFARQELRRIGEHLDALPVEHRLPMPATARYFAAKEAIVDA